MLHFSYEFIDVIKKNAVAVLSGFYTICDYYSSLKIVIGIIKTFDQVFIEIFLELFYRFIQPYRKILHYSDKNALTTPSIIIKHFKELQILLVTLFIYFNDISILT